MFRVLSLTHWFVSPLADALVVFKERCFVSPKGTRFKDASGVRFALGLILDSWALRLSNDILSLIKLSYF
ncbi:hypothetical protein DP113_29580 [Brasilonema octagenarum UFV-E1]|uniref:Uncharacterized protein n=2 Tax=Brasilonema TaxID=383614 RepID=A0A856MPJ8_9CYAN|nr:hypothetical protein [Brasilonema octagenarum UFV-OR1]QDL11471.1 hypothetical protein DP114_29420 [Brasilonema sennae CENA114]QDL17854.1 hypothetical protein DP113_29580 [Brasilonema octagenarum UFV-E1]